jgi:hypothetical protein
MDTQSSSRLFRYTTIVLALAFSYLGINGWWHQWSKCTSVGLMVQTIAQLAYGLLGLVAGILLIRKRRLPKFLEWSWPLTMAIAAGMAPVVWGGTGILPGVTSGVAGLLLGVGIIWLARKGTRV